MGNKSTFILKNDLSELSGLNEKIKSFVKEKNINTEDAYSINLALDEIITNIVSYAYTDSGEHEIQVVIDLDGDVLSVNVTDDGKFFDPTVFSDPQKNLPFEEREPGGLGIHLAGKMVDSMFYERRGGKNVLTLKKKLWDKKSS